MIKQTVPLSWTLHTDCKLNTLYNVGRTDGPTDWLRCRLCHSVTGSVWGDGWDDNIGLKGNV